MSLFVFLRFPRIISQLDNFENFVLIQIFEPSRANHLIMILLREKQTSFPQSFTVKSIGIFENLAHRLYRDVLSQNLLASFLERRHVKAVSQRQQLVDVLWFHLDAVRVDVPQKEKEEVVGHIIKSGHSLLFFGEIMGKTGFKVGWSRSKNHLMAINGLAFDYERYIWKLFLIQDWQKVSRVCSHLYNLDLRTLIRFWPWKIPRLQLFVCICAWIDLGVLNYWWSSTLQIIIGVYGNIFNILRHVDLLVFRCGSSSGS